MKFRSTWIFAVAVAILAAYSLYDFKASSEDQRAGERDLFSFKMEQVEAISIVGPQGKVILEKKAGHWRLVSPIQDDAEDLAVQSLLLTLFGEKGREFSESKGRDAKDYGLVPPQLTIEVKGAGKSESLEISSTNAFDGSFYIRSQGQLMLGDKMWARVIAQKPSSLRDHKILPNGTEVSSVDVNVDTPEYRGRYSFKKVNGAWKMSPDPGFPIESIKVDHWLDTVQGLRANEFAIEHLDSLEQFQLNKPSLQLALHQGEKVVWNLRFSPDHGAEVHVKSNLKNQVYSIGQGQMRAIRVSPKFFRDGKLPFHFPLEVAHEIEVQLNQKALRVQKGDKDWNLVDSGKERGELSQPRLIEFMQKLKSLEAVDFPKQGTAFSPRAQFVRIKDRNGKVLLEFQIGPSYKADDGLNKGVPLNFVRVAGQSQILGLKSQVLIDLLAPDIVKGKSENH